LIKCVVLAFTTVFLVQNNGGIAKIRLKNQSGAEEMRFSVCSYMVITWVFYHIWSLSWLLAHF
jgi:hypothetical protein